MMRKMPKGVVGILDDGTVLVCCEEAERELKAEGVKTLRVGKITTL